jgi:tetratricopeptide (TPR) repeat protein
MQTNKKLRVSGAKAHLDSAPGTFRLCGQPETKTAAVPPEGGVPGAGLRACWPNQITNERDTIDEGDCHKNSRTLATSNLAPPETGARRDVAERGAVGCSRIARAANFLESGFFRPALLTIALLVVLASGCTPAGPGALLEGQRLIEEGKYVPAIEKLRLATTLLPTNALAWNYLGLAYHHAGESANALGAYQRTIKLNHELVVVHYDMGCLYLEQNKPNLNESARDELMAFTLHQGNSLDGRLKLGTAQLRLGELAPAEASFREALRISPQNVEAMNGIGMVQVKRNHARDAIAWFEAASKQKPEYAPAILNLAIVLQSSANSRSLALQKYHEYLALTPRPANWEAVSAAERELELELNPPAPPPVRPATNALAGPPPNVSRAPTNPPERVASAPNNSARPDTVHPISGPTQLVGKANAPATPSSSNSGSAVRQSPIPARVEPTEVVKLSDAPTVKLADDTIPPTVTQKTSPSSNDPTIVTDADTASSSGGKTRAVANTSLSRLRPEGTPPTNRYNYRSPAKPPSGDRVAAEKVFAQALEAQRDRRLTDAVAGYRASIQADPAFFEAQCNLGLSAYDANDIPQSLYAYETALAIKPDSFSARFNFALALKKGGYVVDSARELERSLVVNKAESPTHLAEVHLMLANLYAEQFNQPSAARPHYLKVLDLDPNNTQATTIRYWLRENP